MVSRSGMMFPPSLPFASREWFSQRCRDSRRQEACCRGVARRPLDRREIGPSTLRQAVSSETFGLRELVPLLERDVVRTLGARYKSVVRDAAANVQMFGLA